MDELYSRIERLGRPPLNLYRVLANQPPALAAFLDMSAYVRGSSTIDPRLRELIILATAHELRSDYELAQHREIARRAGVPAAKVDAAAGGALDGLDEAERCAVDYARQVARTRTCDGPAFECLQSRFTPAAIVDIVVTVAWYHLCAAILGPLEVEVEGRSGDLR